MVGGDAPAADAPGDVDARGRDDAAGIDARDCGDAYLAALGIAGRTYRAFTNRVRWTQALTTCIFDGAHLVIVDDPAENAAVRALSPVDANQPYLWVGVSDTDREGAWVTVAGVLASYLPWAPVPEPQPNGGTTENCGLLGHTGSLSEGQLFDYDCAQQMYFTCECE